MCARYAIFTPDKLGKATVFAFAKSGVAKLVVAAMIIMNMTLKMRIEKNFHTFFFFLQGKTSFMLCTF